MIHAKNLPIKLWAEAVNTAVYVLNKTGSTSVVNKTPNELWFRKQVHDVNYLRIFGTKCYVHIPRQRRQKWDKKSTVGYFVGYCGDKDGYRIWVQEENKVVLSRDVVFERENVLEKKVQLCLKTRDCPVCLKAVCGCREKGRRSD